MKTDRKFQDKSPQISSTSIASSQHLGTPETPAANKQNPAKRSHKAGEGPGSGKRTKPTAADAISSIKESMSNLPHQIIQAMPPDTPATWRKALKLLFQEKSLTAEEKLKLSDLFRDAPSVCDQYIVMNEDCGGDAEIDEMKLIWLKGLLAKHPGTSQQPLTSPFGNLGGVV